MSQEFKKGDRVTWNSHGGSAEGEVLRKIIEDTELAGWEGGLARMIRNTSYAATRAVARRCTNHQRCRRRADGDGRRSGVGCRRMPCGMGVSIRIGSYDSASIATAVQLTKAYDSGSWAFCRRRS